MIDGVVAGTGDSRYLKSIANFLTQYPTYADFAAALVAGTLPIDLNGINPGGWTRQGTAINKSNLLTDATAALIAALTGTTPDTPNEALVEIASRTGAFEVKDYTGAGNATKSIIFAQKPDMVLIYATGNFGVGDLITQLSPVLDVRAPLCYSGVSQELFYPVISWTGATLTVTASNSDRAFNYAGTPYRVVGIRLGAGV